MIAGMDNIHREAEWMRLGSTREEMLKAVQHLKAKLEAVLPDWSQQTETTKRHGPGGLKKT